MKIGKCFRFEYFNLYDSALINTRLSGDYCQDCRITEVSVLNAEGQNEYGYLFKIYGDGTWLDHSIISGKTIKNPMISLVREKGLINDDGTNNLANNIVVYKNYIANRVPADGKIYAGAKDNDYEAIRTGLSETHEIPSHSFVVGNLFENIQGEAEVISNKASENTISFNTIRNSNGSLTNRHGHGSKIQNNFILGDGYPLAGGIRIVDNGHDVSNNYIDGVRYLNTTHHGGIVLLGSDGSGDGGNGYQQVEDVHVEHNTIVDSVNSLNLDGGGKKTQPRHVYIENNIVDHAIGPVFTSSKRGVPTDSEIVGNIVSGQSVADSSAITQNESGFEFYSAELQRGGDDNLYRPSVDSPSLDATAHTSNPKTPMYDMDGQKRSEMTSIGADEVNPASRTIKPLTYADVGPVNYKLTKPEPIVVTAPIKNSNFENWLNDWHGTGGYYTVTGQDAFSGQTLVLDNHGSLNQQVAILPHHHYELSAFVKGNYELMINGIESAKGEVSGDEYKWVRVPFDSGDKDSVIVSLNIPETITATANIANPDFTDKKLDNWTTHENSAKGLGDVDSSSDSAFSGEGSIRFRFKNDEDANDFTATPGASQVISGLPQNTDMTYSFYYCDKMGNNSLAGVEFGAKSLQGALISSQYTHNKDLGNAEKGTNKDCFKKVSTTFNTGDNDSVEIFAQMVVDQNATPEEVKANSYYGSNKFEVRLDHFALSYNAKAPDDLTGYFDEVRVATRTDQANN
ncbi:chondroitinase-B domain-containing protein [Vibrio gallicus]|uniref:chondroitinase-B domain-containing protein n=1 Tax=Vibrio gallicus TaxID=190897 RepID=UPI0021C2A5E0|nr:chondroitinase-B domain-containing protein [Vibrio gallicus]